LSKQEVLNPNNNTPGTAKLMRLLNRSSVLDLIRQIKSISRSEISRTLNISLPTITRIIDELLEKNLVVYKDKRQHSGGRPRALISLNSEGHAVIGVDLGGTKMYGAVADIGGHIQNEIYLPWEYAYPDPDKSLKILFELIEQLLGKHRPENQVIRGIGIGAPSITQHPEGIVTWAPSLGWRELPLQAILQERYSLPVCVENDVNLAALGEYGFGVGKGVSSLVCIAIGTGIGSGIVIDRQIFRGAHQSAGEIGYLLPGLEYVGQKNKLFGALERVASGTGIASRAQSKLRNLETQFHLEDITSEEVFNAARNGEPWAQEVVDETIDYYCLAVSAVSTLIDPEMIVLSGGIARSADLLIEPIITRLEGVIPSIPKLVASKLGYQAAVMGAIMLILDMTTDRVKVNQI